MLKTMLQRGMSNYIVSMFSNWWNKLYDKVLCRGGLSDSFAVGSGVLQGSILGGKFFDLMMDCVLNKLKGSLFGLSC